jgi:hypothetical protein
MRGEHQVSHPTSEPQAFGGERSYPKRSNYNFMLAPLPAARSATAAVCKSCYISLALCTLPKNVILNERADAFRFA